MNNVDSATKLTENLTDLAITLGEISPEDLIQIIDKSLSRCTDEYARSALLMIASRHRNQHLVAHTLFGGTDFKVDLSPLEFPVGLISADESAVLGGGGHLFLIGGSNDVLVEYRREPATIESLANAWVELGGSRSRRAHDLGMRYIQLVIPEKISVLRDLFPLTAAVRTPLADAVDRLTEQRFGQDFHIPIYSELMADEQRSTLYKLCDSHLSPRGAHIVFARLLAEISGSKFPVPSFTEARRGLGDLAFRMMGAQPVDVFHEAPIEGLPDFCRFAEKVAEHVPDDGHFGGRLQVWRNPEAPVDLKVVAFANSFFSFGENGQAVLTWWFARWFKEFHFMWTNEVHFDYAEEIGADVVLWQGVERFLAILPGK